MESRKRKAYTIQDKIEIVDRLRRGESQAAVSRDLGISDSTLRGWLKNETSLRASLGEMEAGGSKRKRQRSAQDPQLEKAVITWFNQERAEGTPISGPLLQDQAKVFHTMIHGEGARFEGSKGWLRNFKSRHDIAETRVRGEQRSADDEAATSYPPVLKKIIEEGGYTAEQIYNADETGLYYKMLPDRTLATRSDNTKTLGFKQAKNRLTVLVCSNSTGTHKLPPLVIGKFAKPRCFHHTNFQTLPVVYNHSKNAWMTSSIFEEWFHDHYVPAVRRHLRKKRQQPKALLLLDNCAAHPKALMSKDKKIVVAFLPKNTTSKIQPMDMGIIATTKRLYRKHLVKAITARENRSLADFLKTLNVKEAIFILSAAWEEVTEKCIKGCWRKGLGDAFEIDSDSDFEGFTAEDLHQAEQNLRGQDDFSPTDLLDAQRAFGNIAEADVEAWLDVDADLPTTTHLTEEEIVMNATATTTTAPDDDDDDVDMEPLPSMSTVMACLQTSLRWLESSENATSAQVVHMRNIIAQASAEARASCKQRKLTDFFQGHSE